MSTKGMLFGIFSLLLQALNSDGKPARKNRKVQRPAVNRVFQATHVEEVVFKGSSDKLPDIVVVNLDDAGYGDLCTNEGSRVPEWATPRLAQLSIESLRLTDFHSAASVCTPSRAAFLTGRFAHRFGMDAVILHEHPGTGLPLSEKTIAHLLKTRAGYQTLMLGKWHLGNERPHHPSFHGFDESLSVPYSHDMACFERWPCRYSRVVFDQIVGSPIGRQLYQQCLRGAQPAIPPETVASVSAHEACPPLALQRACAPTDTGRKYYESNCQRGCNDAKRRFTKTATKSGIPGTHALSLALYWTNASCSGLSSCTKVTIEQPTAPWRLGEKLVAALDSFILRRHRPLFAYVAPLAPHLPFVPAPRHQRHNSSTAGLYAPWLNTLTEVDETIGNVLDILDKHAITNSTFLIVTSDNGALKATHTVFKTGSLGPYTRGGKFTAFEGGHRVFGLLRWPERIAPGVSHRLTSQLDLVPTLLTIANPGNLPLPDNLDGRDWTSWLFSHIQSHHHRRNFSSSATVGDSVLLIFSGHDFHATRIGKYKVWNDKTGNYPKAGTVYDILADPTESKPISGPSGHLAFLRSKAASALAAIRESIRRESAASTSKSRQSSTCCNPNAFDCYCPFPSNGLHLLQHYPPVLIDRPSSYHDDRCADLPPEVVQFPLPFLGHSRTKPLPNLSSSSPSPHVQLTNATLSRGKGHSTTRPARANMH